MRLSFLLFATLLATGCSRPVGYDSPEEAFMAAHAARCDSDFGTAFDALTPQSQKFSVGMILSMIGANSKETTPAENAPEHTKKWHASLQKTVDLARNHGVDVKELPGDVSFDVEKCLELFERFPVQAPRQFYAEYWRIFTDEMESITNNKLDTGVFTISHLEYEGDYAYAVKQRENDTLKLPVAFQKINGKWFLDEIAQIKRLQSELSAESE